MTKQEFDALPYFEGDEFRVDDKAVYRLTAVHVAEEAEEEDVRETAICSPIKIITQTANEDDDDFGKLIAFVNKKGDVVEHHFKNADLGPSVVKALVKRGLHLHTPSSGHFLVAFLHAADSDTWRVTKDQVGWITHKDGQRTSFVLPDRGFGPDNPLFTGRIQFKPYGHQGTLDDWQQNVARVTSFNSLLVFSLSLAFAGPLMRPCNIEGGGFHLDGTQGQGKTTCQAVCASVWGTPEQGNPNRFILSWKNTENALEQQAAYFNDCVLLLEELGQANPNTCGSSLYTLSSGQGKGRMNHYTLPWRFPFLSSGEIPLDIHMDKEPRLGQEARFLRIASDAGKGMGVLEYLHEWTDNTSFANDLNAATIKYYGTAGPEFLKHLTDPQQRAGLIQKAIAIKDKVVDEVVSKTSLDLAKRAAQRFGIVAAAGELATHLGITGLKPGEPYQAAMSCFESWLKHGLTLDSRLIHVERIRRALQKHLLDFYEIKDDKVQSGEIHNIGDAMRGVGFKKTHRFLVSTPMFNQMCHPAKESVVLNALKNSGYLDHDPGRLHKLERIPGIHYALRFVAIREEILNRESLIADKTIEIESSDRSFPLRKTKRITVTLDSALGITKPGD
jgi:putative DNA primase/helicase